jgi:hypothetical protein
MMPLWEKGAKFAARRMPKVINPATHAVLDYVVAGSFLLNAYRLWNRNRRAAAGSLICGGATLANALMTDYPGGAFNVISYRAHGRNDSAIAGFAASAPRLMGFADRKESRFFSVEALTATVVIGLTDFEYYEETKRVAA